MRRILILTFLSFVAMCLGGCSLQINSLVQLPKHLDFTMTGVTISWPVILGGLVVVWLVMTVKRWIRDAGKNNKRD